MSTPLVLGATVLLASAGAAITTAPASVVIERSPMSALTVPSGGPAASAGASSLDRRPIVSRGYRREARRATDQNLLREAERLSRKRNAALVRFTKKARAYSAELERNKWYLPVDYVALTARYGQYGLWASSHTGLDFNGDEGDPIYAVANGVVTSVGYDGAYGNKTVVTLEDGTEIWYCHQSRYLVNTGDQVRGGEQIGAIGSTGNVTGSHLHLEVRPDGGNTTDPYSAFTSNDLL